MSRAAPKCRLCGRNHWAQESCEPEPEKPDETAALRARVAELEDELEKLREAEEERKRLAREKMRAWRRDRKRGGE